MGTAVLRSHDFLKDRLHLEAFGSRPPPPPQQMKPSRRNQPRSPPPGRSHPTRPARSSPPPPPPKPAARSNPARPGRRVSFSDKENALVVKFPSPDLVMEKVTILKRGEDPRPPLAPHGAATDPQSSDAGNDDDDLFSTGRMGPEPEILPKQIGFTDGRQLYAGPAFITSPSPSSLPFPAFFLKKSVPDDATRSDLATKSLRCLLRLGGDVA